MKHYKVEALVREEGSIGIFYEKIFTIRIDSDNDFEIQADARYAINREGYEVNSITLLEIVEH